MEFLIIYCLLEQAQVVGKILIFKLSPKMLSANQLNCILRSAVCPELIDVQLRYITIPYNRLFSYK